MRVKGKIYRAILLSTLLYRRLRVATSAFDHEDNLDGRSDKQEHTWAVIYGRSSDQKESPVDWTPHEDVTRPATKADFVLSTVFWSQKERTPSSPVQVYLHEKPEAERHKERRMVSHAIHCLFPNW
ncbi:hypothetical protein NP493_13g05015 [Ridgeia piscesae]|uniref:Uncharacterized protein n=1 Tax=Ridgeia piscesae TaxID=27915 RepID=A0AAD9PEP5_RIDPI|nr:hypothetical protein NP493_13g05015 [Ridgeia piscesae]